MKTRSLCARLARLGAASPLLLGVSGCDQRPKPAPVAIAPPTVPAGIDWSKVEPAETGISILSYKALARYCDGWHAGSTPVITLRFVPPTSIKDDSGHAVDLGALCMNESIWKTIVTLARRRDPEGLPLQALSSKSKFYETPIGSHSDAIWPLDNFGTIPRYKYAMDTLDDETLTFRNVGKYDDGK